MEGWCGGQVWEGWRGGVVWRLGDVVEGWCSGGLVEWKGCVVEG